MNKLFSLCGGFSGYFFVSIVAAAVFKLSFVNLRELAIHFNSPVDDAWLLPIGIDGAIIALSVFAVGRRKKGRDISRIKGAIMAITLASIVCNVAHGLFFDKEMAWIGWAGLLDDVNHAVLGMFVVAIPPALLALMIHFMLADIEAGIEADLHREEMVVRKAEKVARVASMLRMPPGANKKDKRRVERWKKILAFCRENPGASVSQVSEFLKISRHTIRLDMIELGMKETGANVVSEVVSNVVSNVASNVAVR